MGQLLYICFPRNILSDFSLVQDLNSLGHRSADATNPLKDNELIVLASSGKIARYRLRQKYRVQADIK